MYWRALLITNLFYFSLMDLGAIAEANEDDMLDAFISLDYNADNLNDMSLMEILPSMMANN